MTAIWFPIAAEPLPCDWRDPSAADLAAIEADWPNLALCQQVDPEIFFPDKGESTAPAKRVCAACEVRAQCEAHALKTREAWGIWGGLSTRDRARILRDTTDKERRAA